MGLFNNFMPGESYGIPNQSQGGMQGLLSDPLLNIGLGILANNNNRNLGQVLGRGALSGLQNVQQQQQLEQQRKMQDYQAKEYERKQKEFDREQKAIEDFKVKFPEYAGAVDLDPKAAIKAAYPNVAANAVDPYFTPIPTEQGLGRFNARTGQFELLTDPSGKPIIKSTDSPLIRGAVRQAEAGGTAAYNIDTSIPGVVTTAKQVAEQANPSLVQQPIPQGTPMLPQGAPQAATPSSMRVPAPVQRQRDDKRLQILLAERDPNMPNPELEKEIARMGGGQVSPVGGIRIPTPAELAADKARLELQAETQVKAQANLPNIIQEGSNTVKLIDDLLSSKGFKQAVGGSRLFGIQNIPGTSARDFDVRLDQLKGKQFLQAYESLKGAGAITDIEGTKAGNAISRMDASQSEEEFQKAAREFQDIIKSGVELARAKAGSGAIIPKDEAMPVVKALALPAKPSALTLKKGQVYSTPKGNLRWNGKAFED
jgi:hypothetical protein